MATDFKMNDTSQSWEGRTAGRFLSFFSFWERTCWEGRSGNLLAKASNIKTSFITVAAQQGRLFFFFGAGGRGEHALRQWGATQATDGIQTKLPDRNFNQQGTLMVPKNNITVFSPSLSFGQRD